MIDVHTLEIPEMLEYSYTNGEKFFLSAGAVIENGIPKRHVRRWNVEKYLWVFEHGMGLQYMRQEKLRLPTVYETCLAAQENSEKWISNYLFEWQTHLILNSNAPTDTSKNPRKDLFGIYEDRYVLKNTITGKTLEHSKHNRLLNPKNIQNDGEIYVVEADVFDIPIKLEDGKKYELEDLSSETGFLEKPLRSNGKYTLWFLDDDVLHATALGLNAGDFYCHITPSIWPENTPARFCFRAYSKISVFPPGFEP